jgi:hypothetical protein
MTIGALQDDLPIGPARQAVKLTWTIRPTLWLLSQAPTLATCGRRPGNPAPTTTAATVIRPMLPTPTELATPFAVDRVPELETRRENRRIDGPEPPYRFNGPEPAEPAFAHQYLSLAERSGLVHLGAVPMPSRTRSRKYSTTSHSCAVASRCAWSSGAVEEYVNWTMMLKRQVFGRANGGTTGRRSNSVHASSWPLTAAGGWSPAGTASASVTDAWAQHSFTLRTRLRWWRAGAPCGRPGVLPLHIPDC